MSTDPLFMKQSGQYYWYHNDHLGAPQKITTTTGAVVWSAKYSSFGNATVDNSSTVVNPLRFPGQYEDVETGLHYNYQRYYDWKTGRYLKTDPSHSIQNNLRLIPFLLFRLLGHPQKLNVYSYVENNTLRLIDPIGLASSSKCPCNLTNEVLCRVDCGNKGMAFKKCLQTDLGSKYEVECYCEPYGTEKREPWQPPNEPPPPDPCVFAGMTCVKGKWYHKIWACPLYGACIALGGNISP